MSYEAWDYDEICEDQFGELGPWMGLQFRGHLDDETAVALTWAYMTDYGYGYALASPRRTFVRKVPRRAGWMAYVYTSAPGCGAAACTVVETARGGWRYWCDVPACRNQFVSGAGVVGVPRETILNGADLGTQDQHKPGEYAYLCRWHHRRYEEDMTAARKVAMDAYYAERAS